MVLEPLRCAQCGRPFREAQNTEAACSYHPGRCMDYDRVNQLGEGLGGDFWSCCGETIIDSADPVGKGCTTGRHVEADAGDPGPIRRDLEEQGRGWAEAQRKIYGWPAAPPERIELARQRVRRFLFGQVDPGYEADENDGLPRDVRILEAFSYPWLLARARDDRLRGERRRILAEHVAEAAHAAELRSNQGPPPARERWIAYEDREGPHRRRLDVGEWLIGREADCDIVVNDFGLSRRHARLVVDQQTVRLVDLKSKGGTQVNSMPVVDTRLAGGDRLLLGKFPLRFFDGSDDSAADEVEPTAVQPAPRAVEDKAARAEPTVAQPTPNGLDGIAAPAAWRDTAPDRRALIRRIAVITGLPPESLDESSRLRELGRSFISMMYVISTIEGECAVKLPSDELLRINTIGELVSLVCDAPKIQERQ